MIVSDEIIRVLEYLFQKIGVTIDWTDKNVLPYIEQICAKYIKWEIATSVTWICIMIAAVAVSYFTKRCASKIDDFETKASANLLFCIVVMAAVIVIGFQTFDIVKCCTFPEKAVFEWASSMLNGK